ncbi:glycosyl transferase [Leptospira fluminis]|uniref:Glycosyl transferase n=1 Tax=Leptospira fluminis TaxID=2484979 RepID=A0A4V3JEM3_9LEPT|nr:glycosyl transferase [Leptospira fluminis]TGK19356.1 glycosyl transferase [Leptospira fluminis]
MAKIRILAYVGSHGFGHISRSLEAITFLLSTRPEWSATIVSERAEEFSRTLVKNPNWIASRERIVFRKAKTDVGIVQKDSLGMDLEATEAEIRNFRDSKSEWLEKEIRFVKAEKFDLLWSDASSLPFVLSSELGIRSVFLGNFTWDFIYSHYKKHTLDSFAEEIRREYSFCDLGLILPFSCPISCLPKTREIGLLGRKPGLSKEAARLQFGFEKDVLYYLFSFGAYGIEPGRFRWKDWNPAKERIVTSGTELKGPAPNSLGVVSVPPCHYPDLIAACDFVLTKPGYGILSESFLAGTPVLYTDRGDFPEYPYLVKALENSFKSSYIDHDHLYSFRWKEAREQAEAAVPIGDPRLQRSGTEEILQSIEELIC